LSITLDSILLVQYAELKRVEILTSKAEAYSEGGFNCCQSVFAANAESLGVSKELALKITSGMGAGMGRMQETCGAVTGACLYLGLRYGYSDAKEVEVKEQVYGFVQDFHRRFVDSHGTTNCRELLGLDMRSEEGRSKFLTDGLSKSVCLKCVGTADRILREIVAENA
jgi:C_GCAxxG_C_C family probable redox protein